MIFKERIETLFGHYVDEYKERRRDGQVLFVVQSYEVSYESLCRLSELLGTTKIHLDSETRKGGGCSTCEYDYGVLEIRCEGVNFAQGESEAATA